MISKKSCLFIGVLFASFTSFSQGAQAYDVAKQLNPAMAGLEYKTNANLFVSGARSSIGGFSSLIGNYSGFSSKHNIGFGVSSVSNTFNWSNEFFANDNLNKLSLNKQFALSDRLKLSTGVGVGIHQRQFIQANGVDSYINSRQGALQTEIGTVLQGERLQVGLSGGYQFALSENSSYLNQIIFNASASYTFGKADGLQFTPHILLSQVGPNIGGTFKYKSKFMLGGGMAGNYFSSNSVNPYITAGYTIRDKFSINYTYNFQRAYSFPVSKHALTLSFKLGKK